MGSTYLDESAVARVGGEQRRLELQTVGHHSEERRRVPLRKAGERLLSPRVVPRGDELADRMAQHGDEDDAAARGQAGAE